MNKMKVHCETLPFLVILIYDKNFDENFQELENGIQKKKWYIV